MIDFPTSPTEGQVFQQWVWRSDVWRRTSALIDENPTAPYGKARRGATWVEAATKQIAEMDGLPSGQTDIVTPVGVRVVRYTVNQIFPVDNLTVSLRVSLDGTTYSAHVSGYVMWGQYATSASGLQNFGSLTGSSYNTNILHNYPNTWLIPTEGFMILGPTGVIQDGMMTSWPINTASQYTRFDLRTTPGGGGWYTGAPIRGLRFRATGSTAFASGGMSFAAVEVIT